jgi:hypothetical protein
VKLFPFDQIMTRTTLPLSGRLAAYDPLSGVECFPQRDLADVGQIYRFESSGTLMFWVRLNQTVRICGLQPFIFEHVQGNRMWIKEVPAQRVDGRTAFPRNRLGERRFFLTPDRSHDGGQIEYAHRTLDEQLRRVYPDSEEEDGPPSGLQWKPVAIHGRNNRLVVAYETLMKNRAVPFPKMSEAHDKFPSLGSVDEVANTAANKIDQDAGRNISTQLQQIHGSGLLRRTVSGEGEGLNADDSRGLRQDARAFVNNAPRVHDMAGRLASDTSGASRGQASAFLGILGILTKRRGGVQNSTRWFSGAGTTLVSNIRAVIPTIGAIGAQREGIPGLLRRPGGS